MIHVREQWTITRHVRGGAHQGADDRAGEISVACLDEVVPGRFGGDRR
ncbi:hypothetical protein [Actinoallomurus sp. CA-142502]